MANKKKPIKAFCEDDFFTMSQVAERLPWEPYNYADETISYTVWPRKKGYKNVVLDPITKKIVPAKKGGVRLCYTEDLTDVIGEEKEFESSDEYDRVYGERDMRRACNEIAWTLNNYLNRATDNFTGWTDEEIAAMEQDFLGQVREFAFFPYKTPKFQRDAVKKYSQGHKEVRIRLHKEKEQDMIEWLERKDSMQAYIKGLIWTDMQTEKGEDKTE